jgi:hemoglobin
VAQSLSVGLDLGRLSLEHPSRIVGPLHIVS